MPNGHGGVPGYGLALIFGIATVVTVGVSLPEPSPIAQGLALVFAALFGWRVSFYVFMWDALDYGGAMTSDADMRRARRKHVIGSIVFAALSVGAVYAVTRGQTEDAAAIGSLSSRVGELIAAWFDELTTPRLFAWVGGVIVAGFGALILWSNWGWYWMFLTSWNRNSEGHGSPVPLFAPLCLLAGGAIFGEPVSTWLRQGWWALVLFADIHTDWMLVDWVRRSAGFGDTDVSKSDAEGAAHRRRPWVSIRRVSTVLAVAGVLLYFEQSWIAATLEGFKFYFLGLLGGCIFALLPVTSAGKNFLKFIFGFEDDRVLDGASPVFWALLVCACLWALLASAGSFTNRIFLSDQGRTVLVPVVAKFSGTEWGGMRRFAYRVEVKMDERPGIRVVTLPVSKEQWQEMRIGETIQVLATPGLWGPEVVDAWLR